MRPQELSVPRYLPIYGQLPPAVPQRQGLPLDCTSRQSVEIAHLANTASPRQQPDSGAAFSVRVVLVVVLLPRVLLLVVFFWLTSDNFFSGVVILK